jgi:hypothetical protein
LDQKTGADGLERIRKTTGRILNEPFLWARLVDDLRSRGNDRTRESGAFLLGYQDVGRARIMDYVLYDDLDPHCLNTGIVQFNGRYFGELTALQAAADTEC